jgi:beta-glucosidase
VSHSYEFPRGFLWGASTSAYQIEGSPLADGAGPSIWQRFAHSPGRTTNDETGDVACDHYRLWKSDVALMRDLGLRAYRFSISWSRVFPQGTGAINEKGLDFYEHLVDELLKHDITPNATLFHWDLPAALDDRGGWLNRDVAEWFGDYAAAVFARLGDRVPMWATLNEPWVVTDGGYLHGALAPGHRNLFEAPAASHNMVRAHGRGVQAFRAERRAGQIGLVVNLEPKDPATDCDADRAAAKRGDAYMNRQYLDPVFKGAYPDEMREIFGAAWPDFAADDFKLIGEKIDFLGINYYTRGVVRDEPSAKPVRLAYVRQPEHTYTETGWEVHPASLTRTLVWVTERYGRIPLYITENGAAFYDPPHTIDGEVHDPLRVWYFRDHLKAAHDAIRQGVDLRGYFAWSLLDNYEWSLGYSKRFGIVHVNYETQERTPKASARYLTRVIQSNGKVLDE